MAERLDALSVREANGKSYFTKIGVAFPNRDGKGWSVLLDAIPAPAEGQFKIMLREPLPRDGERQPSNSNSRPAPFGDDDSFVALSLHEHSLARKMDRQLVHRNAARSVTAMSAILAHEVKNPMSGIRGAAQLLEQSVPETDRELTRLICEEADRVCALIDRMGVIGDTAPLTAHERTLATAMGRRLAQTALKLAA